MRAELVNASRLTGKTSSIGSVTSQERCAWASTSWRPILSALLIRYVHLCFIVIVTPFLVINLTIALVQFASPYASPTVVMT